MIAEYLQMFTEYLGITLQELLLLTLFVVMLIATIRKD